MWFSVEDYKQVKRENRALWVLLIFCVIALMIHGGCTASVNVKPITGMTAQEKADLATAVYNRQAEDYEARVKLPNLSEAEVKVLNAKYQVLQHAWGMIDTYKKIIAGEVKPDMAVLEWIDTYLRTYRY